MDTVTYGGLHGEGGSASKSSERLSSSEQPIWYCHLASFFRLLSFSDTEIIKEKHKQFAQKNLLVTFW